MLWKISQRREVSLIDCLDIFFNIEYCPSDWYRVFKKSECAIDSDSDQPVLIRLAK